MEDEVLLRRKLARILRAERKRAGFTQQQLADAIGVHQSFYSRLERGEIERYKVIYLVRAKHALGVSYEVLLGEDGPGGQRCRASE